MSRFVELGEGDNLDIDLSEIQAVVFPIEGEEVTIEPKTEEQVILPTSDKKLIKKATVKAVTSEIDANIKPENILLGKTILGVQGNVAPDKPDQTKTTIPTKERQVVRADIGFELAESIVEPIPDEYIDPQGEIEFTENGTYNVREVETAKVNVPMPSGEILIDENNKTYDVKNYETAKVEIAEKPKGEFYVKVFDYDGTQLGKTVWLNNGETYELNVTPPTHDRLEFDTWICTQEMVDGVVTIDGNHVLIGATYVTTSGMNELEIELTPANAPNIETDGFTVTLVNKATMSKYWDYENDQTTNDELLEHTYYKHGKYIIAFEGTVSTSSYIFNQSDTERNSFLVAYRARGRDSKNLTRGYNLFKYCDKLKSVSLSSYGSIEMSILSDCPNIKCIIASSLSNRLDNCYNVETIIANKFSGGTRGSAWLENFVIPKGTTSTSDELFSIGKINDLYIPEGFTSGDIGSSSRGFKKITLPSTISGILRLNYCYDLTEIIGLENTKVTSMQASSFQCNRNLTKMSFPATFTNLYTATFIGCVNIKMYDFSRCLQVPILADTRVFYGIPLDCKIVVPDALYDEWIVATNWVNYQGYIYKASEVQL